MWLACRARCHGVYKRHLDESLFARQFRYDARDASSALCELRAQAAQLHSQSSLARGSGQHVPSRTRTRDVSERGASGACGALARNWEEK